MIDKRPPCPGDILLNPPRHVSWVNRNTREFCCEALPGTPQEFYGPDHDWPVKMQGAGWEAAPIEDGWTELAERPRARAPAASARAREDTDR